MASKASEKLSESLAEMKQNFHKENGPVIHRAYDAIMDFIDEVEEGTTRVNDICWMAKGTRNE